MTNIIMPYAFGNFDYINVWAPSTISFLEAITYATLTQHLFNYRVIIKTTVVTTLPVGLALELNQALIGFLTQLLPLKIPTRR